MLVQLRSFDLVKVQSVVDDTVTEGLVLLEQFVGFCELIGIIDRFLKQLKSKSQQQCKSVSELRKLGVNPVENATPMCSVTHRTLRPGNLVVKSLQSVDLLHLPRIVL